MVDYQARAKRFYAMLEEKVEKGIVEERDIVVASASIGLVNFATDEEFEVFFDEDASDEQVGEASAGFLLRLDPEMLNK